MIEQLSKYRDRINAAIERALAEHSARLRDVSPWGADLSTRLASFTSSGKLIRGSLVMLAHDMFAGSREKDALRAAAVVEMIQSFLLIHDDVMDEDALRRGAPSVHEQYRAHGSKWKYSQVERFGESMAICAGDVVMLIGFSELSGISGEPEQILAMIRLLAQEIADVGVAQMGDVAHGHQPVAAGEDEILAVYRHKTGRYTFSLPLMFGAMLAGEDQETVHAIGQWGELQGIVFQLRDDRIGILESTSESGKPVGSDVTGNKQTLHRHILLDRIAGTPYADVREFFGSEKLLPSHIERLREALEKTETLTEVDLRAQKLCEQSATILRSIPGLTPRALETFRAIESFNATRAR